MLRFLGPPSIGDPDDHNDIGGALAAKLYCCLGASPNTAIPTHRLRTWMWNGEPPETAAASLRAHTSRLRRRIVRVCPSAHIDAHATPEGSAYTLHIPEHDVDHLAFTASLATGSRLHTAGDHDGVIATLTPALQLWRGPAFDGIDIPAIAAVADRLDSQRLDAFELVADSRLHLGDHEPIATDIAAHAYEHPERERLTWLVARALHHLGRRADALALIDHTRRWLATHLDVDPTPAVVALEHDIRSGDPGPDQPGRAR